jgi:predicted RNA-binding Zn-ribbon protein involved in translation (DUF1610 family)
MKDSNTIFGSGLDSSINERYCTHCHIKLVHHNNEKYVYKCPQCGVIVGIASTEPTEKLVTTFPSQQNNGQPVEINKRFIYQATKERVPRNQYFQMQRAMEKNKTEINDPHLREMRKRTDITLTNTEYYDPTES